MTEITLKAGQVWYDPTFEDIFRISEVHHNVGFGELSSDQGKVSHFDSMFLNENMQLLQRDEQGMHWSEKLKGVLEFIDDEGPSDEWLEGDDAQVLQVGLTRVVVSVNESSFPGVYVYREGEQVIGMSGLEVMWAIQQVAARMAEDNEMVSIPASRINGYINEAIQEHDKKAKKRAKKAKKKD